MKFAIHNRLSFIALGAATVCSTLVAWSGPSEKACYPAIVVDTVPADRKLSAVAPHAVRKTRSVKEKFRDLSSIEWQRVAEMTEYAAETDKTAPCGKRSEPSNQNENQKPAKTQLKEKGRLNIDGK